MLVVLLILVSVLGHLNCYESPINTLLFSVSVLYYPHRYKRLNSEMHNCNIHTSYFAGYKGKDGVSISRFPPVWWKGAEMSHLAPSATLLRKAKDATLTQEEWKKEYVRDVLGHLDPHRVASDLNGRVMLCFEKPGDWCHRHYVAEWLIDAGYVVNEFDASSSKKTQPSMAVPVTFMQPVLF